ncbi:hypothetical protein [Thauera humireducens]|uniref:Uncharacterized protein n=1 Tax=Thauera humireducens TaxID=1134435 RepID=A0A127K3R2_9RHOO|nr:hypothetical protein [Thauera humireducens]AMO36603.1 hypothetical protein AC731_006405 [Thauera humireducens]
MYGFKAGAAPKDKPKGGKIKGPGTGTSDSIKTEVPSGSYIMPADSTAKIGEKALGQLGKPVPVNLSNGEYEMPPEAVHAVGAKVLDQMKGATHTPVAARGFKPQEGELFFADGGAVESTDDLIARISAKYGTGGGSSPRPQPAAATAPQQPVQRPAAPSIGSAADALRNRKRQIDAAAGFADGGIVDDDTAMGGNESAIDQGFARSRQIEEDTLDRQARMQRQGRSETIARNAEMSAQLQGQIDQQSAMGRRSLMDEPRGFADGGLVEDGRRRTGPSPQMGAVALGNQARVERSGGQGMYEGANSEIARGFRAAFPSTDTAIRGSSQNIAESYQKGGIPAAIGATVRNMPVSAVGLADDIGRGVKTLIDPAANALKTAVTGDATPIEGTRPAAGFSAQPKSQPATSAPATQQRQAGDPASTSTAAAPQGFNPSSLTEQQRNDAGDAYRSAWQREAPAGMRGANDQALGFYNAEQRVRGSNISARRGANGVMEFSGNGEGALPQNYTRGFDLNAANERMAAANAIRQSYLDAQGGSDGGPRGGVIGNSAVDETNARFSDSALQESMKGMGRTRLNATVAMRNADVASQRAAAELAMREREGAASRGLAAQAEANRTAIERSRLGIDQQRADTEANVRGFEARSLERVEKLYTAYENAKTPEERAAVAEQIRAMNGKDAPNRYTVVPGGQEIDPTTNMAFTRPARVFNNQTGQFVDQQQGAQALPPINENPAVLKIMQNTALTREQRAAQIRALGYQ